MVHDTSLMCFFNRTEGTNSSKGLCVYTFCVRTDLVEFREFVALTTCAQKN